MSLTPEISFPPECAGISVWVVVTSTDMTGVRVDNLKVGDNVEITYISGICSFAEANHRILAGIVAVIGGILIDGLAYKTEEELAAINDAVRKTTAKIHNELIKDVKVKRRDGYGQDPGTGDFAKNEGGIIMCMPHHPHDGALYAVSDNYLEGGHGGGAKKHGRKPEFFSNNIKNANAWFPSNKGGGIMSKVVKQDGTLHMLVFDENFKDNAGCYIMKVHITRPTGCLISMPLLKSKLNAIVTPHFST